MATIAIAMPDDERLNPRARRCPSRGDTLLPAIQARRADKPNAGVREPPVKSRKSAFKARRADTIANVSALQAWSSAFYPLRWLTPPAEDVSGFQP